MGTNYYLRHNACGGCGRYDDIHIGKQSAGWSFLFRAYNHRLLNPEHPDWGYVEQSPFGVPVTSREDWRRILAVSGAEVFDEYGQKLDDPLGWLDGMSPPDLAQRVFENRETHWPSYMERTDWRDAEGFRFEPREFS